MEITNKTDQALKEVIDYLRKTYNTDESWEAYGNRCKTGKVIEFQDSVFISHWDLGAIVCIDEILYFIMENDGSWIARKDYSLGSFSSYWLDSFTKALNLLNNYMKKK